MIFLSGRESAAKEHGGRGRGSAHDDERADEENEIEVRVVKV